MFGFQCADTNWLFKTCSISSQALHWEEYNLKKFCLLDWGLEYVKPVLDHLGTIAPRTQKSYFSLDKIPSCHQRRIKYCVITFIFYLKTLLNVLQLRKIPEVFRTTKSVKMSRGSIFQRCETYRRKRIYEEEKKKYYKYSLLWGGQQKGNTKVVGIYLLFINLSRKVLTLALCCSQNFPIFFKCRFSLNSHVMGTQNSLPTISDSTRIHF